MAGKLLSFFAVLLVLPSLTWAGQEFYREFLSDSGIVSVSGEQSDAHHARITAIQIAHDQYREIRVLDPETGKTDLLEISDPTVRMTYSLPSQGRFLKLQIKRREKNGLRTADFVLSPDGSHYITVRKQFRKYRHFYQALDLPQVGVCRVPQSSLINKPAIDPVIDALLNTPQNVAAHCLDSSCEQPPYLSEYKSMVAGVSQVISSRDSSGSDGGKFLSCLSQHHLNQYAENLKSYFSDSLKTPSEPSVVCEFKNNGTRGEFSEESNLTYFRSPWAYGGSTEHERDSASYYADTFFHESLHREGIEDEDLVHDVVSCCGLETSTERPTACKRVDQQVAETNDRNARLIASMDKLVGFKDFWIKIQKATDEQRVNAFYDDLFEMLKASRNEGGSRFSSCIKTAEKSQDACMQDFVRQTDAKLSAYFDTDCLKRFKDKSKDEQKSLCQSLKKDAISMVQTNLTNVCDPTKSNAFERSCLYASRTEKEQLLADAAQKGNLLEAPELLANASEKLMDKKARDAYLTSFSNQIPALRVAYSEIKEKINDEHGNRAEAIFSSMLGFVGQLTNKIQDDYASCLARGGNKTECAETLQHEFLYGKKGITGFFRSVCPTYFSTSENKDKPCRDFGKSIVNIFKDSFSGGCKTDDSSKMMGVPGHNLTCLFSAITDGKYNLAHYDELAKEKKLIDSSSDPMTNAPLQEAKETAGKASSGVGQQLKSVHIPNQANKEIARESSGAARSGSDKSDRSTDRSWRRSPASTPSSANTFDPSNGFEDQLKNELYQQPTPVKQMLSDASRVISDMAIPSAEADTRHDTSSLAIRAPSALGGVTESLRSINVAITTPSSQLVKASPASRSQTSVPASPDSSSTSGASRSPASSSNASKNASAASSSPSSQNKEGQSKAGQNKTGPNNTKGTVGSSNQENNRHLAASGMSLRSRQKQLLEFFKNEPAAALKKLKNKSLTSDLSENGIEAKDDEGQSHGSKSPQIKIWYDSSAGVFKGLPDL